jgi:hypothetical protein
MRKVQQSFAIRQSPRSYPKPPSAVFGDAVCRGLKRDSPIFADQRRPLPTTADHCRPLLRSGARAVPERCPSGARSVPAKIGTVPQSMPKDVGRMAERRRALRTMRRRREALALLLAWLLAVASDHVLQNEILREGLIQLLQYPLVLFDEVHHIAACDVVIDKSRECVDDFPP